MKRNLIEVLSFKNIHIYIYSFDIINLATKKNETYINEIKHSNRKNIMYIK